MENVRSILLKGYYGFGNLGDDLLMIIAYKLLRTQFPAATITIFSNHTVNLVNFQKGPGYNLYIHRLLGEQPDLVDWTYRGHFDMVVNGGGGVFFDSRSGSVWRALANYLGKKMGATNVRRIDLLARKLLNKKAHISFDRQIGIGIGLGPYKKGSDRFLRHLAEIGSFETLIVRDPRSFEFLAQVKFKGKRVLSSDLAFGNFIWTLTVKKKNPVEPRKLNLGIVLQDIPERREELFASVSKFIDSIDDANVTFFSFDENHDFRFIDLFQTERLIVWKPDTMKLEDFLSEFNEMDAVMSARAHGVILAGLLGIVPLTLNISQKLEEVSGYFAKGGILVNNPFESSQLLQVWGRTKIEKKQLVEKLSEEVNTQVKKLADGVKELFHP